MVRPRRHHDLVPNAPVPNARSRKIGYHASHEQFPPEEQLHLVIEAEKADFDMIARIASFEAVSRMVFIETAPSRYVEWLGALFEAGATAIHLHQVGSDRRGFIETFGAKVLPHLKILPHFRTAGVEAGPAEKFTRAQGMGRK